MTDRNSDGGVVALPRDASAANDFRHLAPSLGSSLPFEKQGVSGTSPKPSPPQKKTAAQGFGAQRGGKTEVKAANFRDADYVRDGLCAIAKSTCPHAGLIADRGAVSAPDAERSSPPVTFDRRLLPSRAAPARKWPRLRINRLTWRWRDDASGAFGADVASLLAFIAGRAAR